MVIMPKKCSRTVMSLYFWEGFQESQEWNEKICFRKTKTSSLSNPKHYTQQSQMWNASSLPIQPILTLTYWDISLRRSKRKILHAYRDWTTTEESARLQKRLEESTATLKALWSLVTIQPLNIHALSTLRWQESQSLNWSIKNGSKRHTFQRSRNEAVRFCRSEEEVLYFLPLMQLLTTWEIGIMELTR